MRLAKTKRLVLIIASAVFTSLVTSVEISQAQEVVKARFVWDFTPASGAVYFNICTDPFFNINERTGGCADINVANENVTQNRDRTKLVSDRLKSGESYKACLVADNTFSNRQGRWIQCFDFVASNNQTFRFSMNRMKNVGSP